MAMNRSEVFLPSFEIRQLRADIGDWPLRTYEALAADVIDPALLISFLRDGWRRDGAFATSLTPPISWSLPNRRLTFELNAWNPLSQLLAGFDRFKERRYFDAAYSAALDWLSKYQVPVLPISDYDELDALIGKKEDFFWYDMSVGLRCYRIAYLIDVAARDPKIGDNEIDLLVKSLYFHQEVLGREKIFRAHNNHGIYQALGQIAAARRFPDWPKMATYRESGERRILRLVKDHVFSDGTHKEHSPGYHHLILQALIAARNAELISDKSLLETVDAMERALIWMIMPDTSLAPIGDTDPGSIRQRSLANIPYSDPELVYLISEGKFGKPPTQAVRVYSAAGYVFARIAHDRDQPPSHWSYFAQMAGFHSRAHKHADHLSFVWHERGHLVLADAGRYEYLGRTEPDSALAKEGFWYADPKRIFVESTRAHNTVEIDGRSFPRANVEPFGSAIAYGGLQGELVITECEATYFNTVRHRRVLVLLPGEFLLVLDALSDDRQSAHDYVQRFNFAPAWQVDEADGEQYVAWHPALPGEGLSIAPLWPGRRRLAPARGQETPELLGWYSDRPGNLVPSTTIAYAQYDVPAARLGTLFAFGRHLDVRPGTEPMTDDLGRATFNWILDDRAYNLTIARDDVGQIRVKLG